MTEGIGFTKEIFSAFRPSSYGTVRAWYDASQESFADSAVVSTATDWSGNARHATQATVANKPLFKLNVANGLPAFLFDGVNDYLQTASFTARAHPVTAYFVVKRTGSIAAAKQIADGIGASNRMSVEFEAATGKPVIYSGGSVTGFDDMGSDWCLVVAVFDGASSKIWINDIVHAVGNSGAQTLTGIILGASYLGTSGWGGYIAEAIYFDGALTTDNDYTVRRALQAKYKIPYFDPLALVTLESWFAADRISGLRDGEAVSLWEDAGPAGVDLVQVTGSKQPLFKRDILNHRSVVRFDGLNDSLVSSAFSARPQPQTIIVVAKHNSTATHDFVFDGIASGNRRSLYYEQTTGKLGIYGGTAAILSAADAGTSFLVASGVFNGASSAIYKNQSSVATGSIGTHSLTGYRVGSLYDETLPLDGDIAEILIGNFSAIERQRIEGYLRGKDAL